MKNKFYGGLESLDKNDFNEAALRLKKEIHFSSIRESFRDLRFSLLARLMLPFVWLYLRAKRSYYGHVDLSDKSENMPIIVHMHLADELRLVDVIMYDSVGYLSYSNLQKFLRYRKDNKHLTDITSLPGYPKEFDPDKYVRLVVSSTGASLRPSASTMKTRINLLGAGTERAKRYETYMKRLDENEAKRAEENAKRRESNDEVTRDYAEAFIAEGDIPKPRFD